LVAARLSRGGGEKEGRKIWSSKDHAGGGGGMSRMLVVGQKTFEMPTIL